MVAYLDRINIGYAQLQMKQVLPFGDAVYGLGAGIFLIGYFLFEDPHRPQLRQAWRAALALRRQRDHRSGRPGHHHVDPGRPGCSVAALSLAVIGIAAATPLFFTITTEYLSKVGAAAGIALISSLGNLGPAASPAVTGAITLFDLPAGYEGDFYDDVNAALRDRPVGR